MRTYITISKNRQYSNVLNAGPYHSEFKIDNLIQWSVLIYIILIYHRSKKKKIKLLFKPSTNRYEYGDIIMCLLCCSPTKKTKKNTSTG